MQCVDGHCESISIPLSDNSMLAFGARNSTGQNIFWDSTSQFSNKKWTQYMLGFYQLWIDGIIWGNSTYNTSFGYWTKMKSFQISEIKESYSGIYPQLSFNITFEEIVLPNVDGHLNNITLIVSHRITCKENETLTKLSIYLDLTNFIPYWNNTQHPALTPYSPSQKIFIGINYRTQVLATKDRSGQGDHYWIFPDSFNDSSVTWTVEGMQCTSMQFERNVKRLENGIWLAENASSSIKPVSPQIPVVWFSHVVPNCSVNTTCILIDPIIDVNGDFSWWSNGNMSSGLPIWATILIIIAIAVIALGIVIYIVKKKRKVVAPKA